MTTIKKNFTLTVLLFVLGGMVHFSQAQAPPPDLISPANGASEQPTTITFEWSSVSNADRYQIQVASDSSFSGTSILFSDNTTSTSITVSGFSHSTTYYWRVRSGTDPLIGGTTYGDWTETRNFTTVEAPPPAPALTSPENNATEISTSPTLVWEAASRADTYQVQVSQNSSFSSLVVDRRGITATEAEISDLQSKTSYYWRIRATNNGGTSNWSQTRNFTTVEAPPPAPALASPEDSATEISTSPTLNWETASRANTYQVQVAQNSDFSSPVVDQSGISATETAISDLQKGTTYYWRVRATNNGGSGEWSQTRNFTTVEAPPPMVRLVNPDSGATGVSRTPRFDWEPADRAEGYDLQIAVDQNFDNKVVNLKNVTSTHYDAELQGFTTYYWRVRGQNNTASGDWSHVWSFTTEQTGSEISIIHPNNGDLWEAGETASIRWNATNNVEYLTIEYKLASDEQWSVIVDSVSTDSSPYAWKIPVTDSASTQTLIRVSDSDNPDIQATSNPFILYPASLQLQQDYIFNSTSSASDYQLIGLPANSNLPIDDLMSGQSGNDWNAYFDNGSQENYMVEFDGSERFNMSAGRAFFVISKNDISLSKKTSSVNLSSDTTYTIPLHDGWNMISNPFGVTIPWANVQSQNDISSTLWKFDGSFGEAANFETYKGYYFFNQDSLDQLKIPYQPADQSNKSTKLNLKESNRKALTLKLLSGGTEHSFINLGFDPKINSQNEERIQFAPPGDFQDYKLTILSKRFSGRNAQLHKQFVQIPETKHSFPIRLKANPEKNITIKTEGLENFTGYKIALINKRTSKSYDLTKNRELFLSPDQPVSSYQLVIGSEKGVAETENNLIPEKLSLSQNYPNPFNGQTVIEYSIPKQRGQTRVHLEVFDILGRKIYTLVNRIRSPGFYRVRWNGENSAGQSLASGVYYYRLRIGQNVLTKKLTLIK